MPAPRPTVMAIIIMDDIRQLHLLLAWTSPSYPTGAFSYSQGLEWAVEAGDVKDENGLFDYGEALARRGALAIDAALFAHIWRAAADDDALDEIAAIAAAWRGSAEAALESHQQGNAFLATVRTTMPHSQIESFADRLGGRPVAFSTTIALACAAHGIAAVAALNAFLHGALASLVSAAIRLGVTGQTGGQRTVARFSVIIPEIAHKALDADLDRIGSSAAGLDLCALSHETQRVRLFRS
jgi:urease accessory protein